MDTSLLLDISPMEVGPILKRSYGEVCVCVCLCCKDELRSTTLSHRYNWRESVLCKQCEDRPLAFVYQIIIQTRLWLNSYLSLDVF